MEAIIREESTMPVTSGRRTPSILLPFILLVATAVARAEVYTWQDESGQQRFSDRPPETRDYGHWEPPENPNSDLQLPEPRDDWPDPSANDQDDKSSSRARAERLRQEKKCREYDAELKRITNELRSGYREPTGNRLRAKRRQLRSKQFNECR